VNQPKSVDSIIDSFAVEAQNFANSLNQSATLLATSVALRLLDKQDSADGGDNEDSASTIYSTVLAGISPLIAVGTITNASRYKNRNEIAREEFMDTKYTRVLLDVYKLVDAEGRANIMLAENPFFIEANSMVDMYLTNYRYYYNKRNTDLMVAFDSLKRKFTDRSAVEEFNDQLLKNFILNEVSSYLQEDLVKLYELMSELAIFLKSPACQYDDTSSGVSRGLYRRLFLFKNRLDPTLQRGPIKFGFFKMRKMRHAHLFACFQYVYYLFYCQRTGDSSFPTSENQATRVSNNSMKPIAAETAEIIAQLQFVSDQVGVPSARAVQDLRTLQYATVESYVTSLIIISGWITFFSGIVFTAGNICLAIDESKDVCEGINDGAMWSLGITAPIAAYLVILLLSRKMGHLIGLHSSMRRKARTSDNPRALRKALGILATQQFATLLRIVAGLGAAFSLICTLEPIGESDKAELVALGSLALQIVSTIFLFLIEYSMRWNLDPKLGEYVCESYKDDIEDIKDIYSRSIPRNNVKTQQIQDKTLWEYVTREFLHRNRFDTLFSANRFGNIMQYLQSGLAKDRYVEHNHFATASVRNLGAFDKDAYSRGGKTRTSGQSGFKSPVVSTRVEFLQL